MATYLNGSTTLDPASVADQEELATDVTVTGAVLGDFVSDVSCSVDVEDLGMTAAVTSADTVTVVLVNNTTGAVDLGSCTFRVQVKTLSGQHLS